MTKAQKEMIDMILNENITNKEVETSLFMGAPISDLDINQLQKLVCHLGKRIRCTLEDLEIYNTVVSADYLISEWRRRMQR